MNKSQLQVDDWNAKHPIGTAVKRFPLINPRRGSATTTKTRSRAWVSDAGYPLVLLEHITGACHLDSVEVVP